MLGPVRVVRFFCIGLYSSPLADIGGMETWTEFNSMLMTPNSTLHVK